MKSFFEKIKEFNRTYSMPKFGTFNQIERFCQFQDIIEEEIREGDDVYKSWDGQDEDLTFKTNLADWLADVIVYCASEAERWNIPIEDVLHIIMASNASKLGADGKPIYDERGKLLKGPNYWKPEPKIRELLKG